MNKSQVKGRVKTAKGKGKEVVGRAVGNERLEQKGKAEQAAGKVESAYGDLKSDVERST